MADYIDRYTKTGDIVLDPFCGSGVSVTEAVFNDRKGLGVDINPSAILITEQIINKVDVKLALKQFSVLENELKSKINDLYLVERNGNTYIGHNFLWENEKLIEVRYTDPLGRARSQEIAIEKDTIKSNEISYSDIDSFYPKEKFFHNSRINAKGNKHIYELFTPRSLYALSLIYENIGKIENDSLRSFFKFCFTSAMGQTSKMVFVIKRRNKTKTDEEVAEKKEIGSWVIGYWAPKEFFENNVWTCFESRWKKIIKEKKLQEKIKKSNLKALNFDELLKSKDYLLINQPSQKYLKELPDNSIDYILTDPPHGNRIPYLELSLLWNSWLGNEVNYDEEIIISESKERKKDSVNYDILLTEVLKECFRILKPNKHLSFMFNSLDDTAWINMVNSFHKIGFVLDNIETMGYSANSVVQDNRKNGLQTDFILTFKKTSNSMTGELILISDLDKKSIEDIGKLKDSGYKNFQIINKLLAEHLREGKFIKFSHLIQTIENA